MAVVYAQLKSEIQNDPSIVGYAAPLAAGNNQAIADLLNGTGAANQIQRETVPAYEVFEAIVPAEWASLSAQEKQRIQTVLSMGTVNLKGANTRASLAAAFGAGTATRTALLALQNRNGSRAETLFGAGTVISNIDVAAALALPS